MIGKAVSPSLPREKYGIYWGYNVRLADNLKKVWSECPFEVLCFLICLNFNFFFEIFF